MKIQLNIIWGRTQTTWPFGGRGGGQAKHHVKPRGGGGDLGENHVTFFPSIFAFLFPTKQGNGHLLRALNQATTTLWKEEEVEKDSIF